MRLPSFAERLLTLLRRVMPRSLALRVYLLYSISLATFAVATVLMFYRFQFTSLVNEVNQDATLTIDLVSESVTSSAIIGDYDTIRKLLEKTVLNQHFNSASFIDVAGSVTKAEQSEPTGRALIPPPAWLENLVSAHLPDANQVIKAGGKDYGVLRLGFDVHEVTEDLWRALEVAIALSVVSLLVGLGLVWGPLHHWLGSLDAVAQIAASGGDVSQSLPIELRETFGVLQRTAANLRASRAEAVITLGALRDAVITFDADGHIILANPAAGRIAGVEHPVGASVYELFPDAIQQRDLLSGVSSRRTMQHREGQSDLVLEISLAAVEGAPGKAPVAYVFIARDVTEVARTELQLLEQFDKQDRALRTLRTLLDGMHNYVEFGASSALPEDPDDLETMVMQLREVIETSEESRRALDNQKFAMDQHAIVCVTDRMGLIEYANDRLCRIAGYEREELLGSPLGRLVTQADQLSLYAQARRQLLEGHVWNGELCQRTKGGTPFWVSATMVPMANGDDLPQQFIVIQTDISTQKATEAALQEAKVAAEAANRAKSQFVANMSHEIRTPMNGIIGMTELALDTTLDDEQRGYLTIVRTSALSLLGIINDILDFSKIEAGMLTLESVPFNLRRTVGDVVDVLRNRATVKGLQLELDVTPDVPDGLLGDPTRLKQVLMNLVGNSIKFTERGHVRLTVALESLQPDSVRVRIAVLDTGIGIPKNQLDRLFKPFSQVDESTTRVYGGTGLGLSISADLVAKMHGKLSVYSEPGAGSTFWFTCIFDRDLQASPVLEAAPLPAAPVLRQKMPDGTDAPTRILVVEDNAVNQQLAKVLLGKMGCEYVVAENGIVALQVLARERFDLVLMDCQMPEMDGYTATRRIRDHDSNVLDHDIPVVALTANAMSGDRERVLEAGMDDYITKPIRTQVLADAIARWRGKKHGDAVS